MINVLHIAVGNIYGGIETMLTSIARHRREPGIFRHEFSICFEGRFSAELEALGAAVHRLGPVRASRPWTVAAARARLRKLVLTRRVDVAICHSGWTMALLWPAARRASMQVFWGHNDWQDSDALQRLARRRKPQSIVANSSFTAASLTRAFPRAKVEVIHCPVEPAGAPLSAHARTELRAELGASPADTVILQVSRMEAWKGHAQHLRALALLKAVPNWKCWLAGGAQRGEEERYVERLRALTQELGIEERVVFAGARSDVRRLIAAADIFCQPNLSPEPFGIVFAEALHARRPVVTTRLGGVTDLVDHTCGMLVSPGDPGELAAALQRLILNPRLRAELGNAGPARTRLVTDPERQLVKLEDFFAERLPSGRGASEMLV